MNRWKSYPGQIAQNGPNLRKQILMLLHLYVTSSLRAAELFNRSGVGGVTGARYVSALKKFELIRFTGARKKGHYEITRTGMNFVENAQNVSGKSQVTDGLLDKESTIKPVAMINSNVDLIAEGNNL